MMNYQKSISYLDYLENGMKIRNAGFVRAEEKNGQMRLEVRMKNLPDMFSGQYDLHADNGGVIGKISLNRGSGSCCIVWDDTERDKRRKVEAGSIYLRLPGRRLVQAVWPAPMRIPVEPEAVEQRENERQESPESSDTVMSAPAATAPIAEQTASPVPMTSAPAVVSEPAAASKPVAVSVPAAASKPAAVSEPTAVSEPAAASEPSALPEPAPAASFAATEPEAAEAERRQEHFYTDKWEQLTHMYPLIHPFGDERAYLSIAPKDFVVLCRDYQKMVHNSFLLHGFYNYHHLLLGKIQEKGEWRYYLGVPGNFYTREKMVAEMFGFEAFEGEKNPASPGDFGYYMKQVDI